MTAFVARHRHVAHQRHGEKASGFRVVEPHVRPIHRRTRQAGRAGTRAGRPVQQQPEAPRGVSPASRVLIERLDAHHDVSAFDSGNEVLDTWLCRHAPAAQSMDSERFRGDTKRPCRRLLQPDHGLGASSRGSRKAHPRHAGVSRRHGAAGPSGGRPVTAGTCCGTMLLAEALRRRAGRSPPDVSSWWMLSMKTRPPFSSGTVSSEHRESARLHRRMKDVRASLDWFAGHCDGHATPLPRGGHTAALVPADPHARGIPQRVDSVRVQRPAPAGTTRPIVPAA